MVKNKIAYTLWGAHQLKDVYLFRIENEYGAYAEFTNYGATVTAINVPDKNGTIANVVLGFDNLQAYLNDSCYIGSTIGRFANRIANATFNLDKVAYHLERNDGSNSNHGGYAGFHSQVFDFEVENDKLVFKLFSKEGEGGYPGNVALHVSYEFTNNNELIITYYATTDKRTVLNFTNHSYFNLSGQATDVLNHQLSVNANFMLESDSNYIPTGTIKAIGKQSLQHCVVEKLLYRHNNQLKGLNDYYIKNKGDGNPIARLQHQLSGRCLDVFTSYPGIQIYTGDYLNSSHPGNNGKKYKAFDGLCLECQYYPDSPNRENFLLPIVDVNRPYFENIVFKFSVER